MEFTKALYASCRDLDLIVEEKLGRRYNSLHSNSDGYNQNELVSFDTDTTWTEEDEAKDAVELWLASPPRDPSDWRNPEDYPDVEYVLEYLHAKGHIEPGFYVIDMWW